MKISEAFQFSIVRFGFVGILINSMHYSIFACAIVFDYGYILALSVSTVLIIPIGFLMHRSITFGDRPKKNTKTGIVYYISKYIFLYLVNLSLLYFLVEGLGLKELVAQLISIVICAGLSFLILSRIIFQMDRK